MDSEPDYNYFSRRKINTHLIDIRMVVDHLWTDVINFTIVSELSKIDIVKGGFNWILLLETVKVFEKDTDKKLKIRPV